MKRLVICADETPAQAIAAHRQYCAGKIIGEPKATRHYTVEQLQGMKLVGVYVETEAADAPAADETRETATTAPVDAGA
jgi:hypothetical protein